MSDLEQAATDVVRASRAISMLKIERDQILWDQLPTELKQAQEEVRAEYATAILGWEAELEAAKTAAETAVLQAGATYKTDGLQIVYAKGKEGAWDAKELGKIPTRLAQCPIVSALRMAENDKFADALEKWLAEVICELLDCRKPAGEPSVRFVFKEEK